MNKSLLFMTCVLLAGCASQPPKSQVTPLAPASAPVAQPQPVQPAPESKPFAAASESTNSMATCRKELDALKHYGPKTYSRYAAEMDALTAKTGKYLSIKEGLTPELNDIVITMYQSQIKTLCFRIQSSLGKLIIEQAGG
ncbi:hypothetical protein QMW88_07245 [Cronobacter dublinensis]|uniref:hypothetical protein n=1 Tax=Cronobacter dublinensis TaxID=413497 RepID=UPI000CFBD0E9|nr:hypothetical protein [Cronobacter dublinensis]MDI6443411.1 hypothetical protein [Cronobacter dublinensis]MDK1192606.1 hypothetical protein [Cronobacter dublinensis]MDK1201065.1 hypothetical protein [Cronobacter dublinensis]